MKKHTKIYVKYFNLIEGEYKACEWCQNKPIVDIHHISPRGMGGNKNKDYIENLMGLCRDCHNLAEAKHLSQNQLLEKHLIHLRGDFATTYSNANNS